MLWDRIAPLYDFFENAFNRKVYDMTGPAVASLLGPCDEVLECACGTGGISVAVARVCKRLVAPDYSEGMLRRARTKLAACGNVLVEKADITALPYEDDSFDAAVAGNVLHLLPEPADALAELRRVVRPGGMIIVPTYLSATRRGRGPIVAVLARLGLTFHEEFDADSYRAFFEAMGYTDVSYRVLRGAMPCAIASFVNRDPEC